MKKILFALLLGGLLVLALATVATADNGPHGGFTATTDACAGCHRVHTALFGSNALLTMDPEALCNSCHDGSGAATDVVNGVYRLAGSPYGSTEGNNGWSLFGGGFTNALMATAWSGANPSDPPQAGFDATSRATTSAHNVGVSGTIWGSGANNSQNGSMVLECTSCHDPHGTAGYNTAVTPAVKVASYRLLRFTPQGSGGFTPPADSVNWSGGAFPAVGSATGWTVPDNYAGNGNEWYTIGAQTLTCGSGATAYPCGPFAAGDYNNGNANNTYQPQNAGGTTQSYVPAAVNTAFFCAQCHDRYFNNSRLRNATDDSVFCGAPVAKTVNNVVLTVYPPTAAGLHPLYPDRCLLVTSSTTGLPTGWGDNGDSGDFTYMYRHSSGDIRLSMDGVVAAGAGTSVSRSCVACHVAHGTAATMTTLASNASQAHDSALLRMDNRSVCLRCHASTVNFVYTAP